MSGRTDTAHLQAAYSYCATITRKEARNFYYAFITLPHARRRAVYAAYAFSRLADDIADGDGTAGQKAEALGELRTQLREAFAGDREGLVFTALADAATTYGIPESLFHDILDGVEMDLVTTRYETFEDLKEYCYRVASAVGLVSIHIFGYREPQQAPAEQYAVDFGLAMQLTNILRDLREDMERNRIYLPQEDLRRFGYTEQQLRDGVINGEYQEMMRFQAERARIYFASGARLLPLLDSRSRPCAAGLHEMYSRLLD
ncbi:MAG: phytoene/squalene synthase family protein, partial [Dehalococcoidia bacterium]